MLQILSSGLFFWSYPYSETEGNCAEIFVGRLHCIFVAFGELHQVYFVANVLGLQRLRFHFPFTNALSLEAALRWATVLAMSSILLSIYVRRLFMTTRDTWGLFIALLQIYVIRHARQTKQQQTYLEALVDPDNDAVVIFEMLSWLQVIPYSLALIDRVFEFQGFFVHPYFDGVMLIVEHLGIYLFYIKVVVLQEKANAVSIDVQRT